MPRITINGNTVQAAPGQSILDAARAAGITIPTLCHHSDLSVAGSCRLCLVEVEGRPGQLSRRSAQVVACSQPVCEGMVIQTESATVVSSRRLVLQLLLLRYFDSGNALSAHESTEFMRWVHHYGVQRPAEPSAPRYPVDSDANPFVWVDMNKCILCTRCVRACREVQGRFVWGVSERGNQATIAAGAGTPLLDARCESCGACVAYCPTGALDDKMSVGLGRPDRIVPTTCVYCGVGCGLDLNVKHDRIIRVTSNPAAPVNGMSLCVKGRYGYDFVHHPDRLTMPHVRRYLLEGKAKASATGAERDWVDVEWPVALDLVARKIVEVARQTGPETFGVLGSAKCTNEENYLMQKFARQVLGCHNVDHCARLCHASTVAGLTMALGAGAMSNSMDDVAEQSTAVFLIGSNVTEQHPVFGTMLRQAVLQRNLPLVVADPRRIDITEFATLHLQHQPGTDIALVNGLMHVIWKNNWHDADFITRRCENFEELAGSLEGYSPERVSAITGVAAADLTRAARLLSAVRPMAVIWAMGITQHTTGVLNVLSLANLQMLLGNFGVPGGGVNPLRGQNNVQGACDVGVLPNLFPAYQAVGAGTNAQFASAWATEPPAPPLPLRPGLTVTEMVDAFGAGRLRVLYVLGEDLALTEPDLNHTRACLARGEFLVLQEIFPSETAGYVDVLLPGAAFAEKSGTFTNTERRVQAVRQAVPPPGAARADWAITAELARRVLRLQGRQPRGPQAAWDYAGAAAILAEVAALTPPYAGVSWERLQRGERLQWPVPHVNHPGTPILHVERFTRGRGRFHVAEHLPAAELPDADYPLLLTTGRVLYHWHGGELTRRSHGLQQVYPQTLIEINPHDALALGLREGSEVRVRSRRGSMLGRSHLTERVAAGVVFGNFHFPGSHNVNNVTIAALDPVAKIPEFKVCAVAVEAVPDGCLRLGADG
jgi:formate dehydrogenase alpha subunit